MNIIITLLILGLIILIHELGHFLTAKFFGMPVEEFALGMGPTIYSYDGLHTKYSIRAIPMGGFVNIKGMEVDSVVKNGFNSKPAYQRFLVLVAGVVMNFLLAYIIVLGTVLYNGEVRLDTRPIVGKIIEMSNAKDELKIGDKVISINGEKIEEWDDITKVNREIGEKKLAFVIERDGKTINQDIDLTYSEKLKGYYIGIIPQTIVKRYGLIDGIGASFRSYKNLFMTIVNGFEQLVTGKVSPKEISGPVGIVKIVGTVSHNGVGILFWLTALLSVNIGFFNLLPFPALDGGRIVFVILESVGIKINKKFEEKFHMVGMIVLFTMIIAITFNDVLNIFKK